MDKIITFSIQADDAKTTQELLDHMRKFPGWSGDNGKVAEDRRSGFSVYRAAASIHPK